MRIELRIEPALGHEARDEVERRVAWRLSRFADLVRRVRLEVTRDEALGRTPMFVSQVQLRLRRPPDIELRTTAPEWAEAVEASLAGVARRVGRRANEPGPTA